MNLNKLFTAVICILILSAFIYVLIPTVSQSSTSYEVISVSIYHEGGAFSTPPATGYVIICKDGNEIITFDINSDRMTIYETNTSSNIIITTEYGYTSGELYWNQNQHSIQRL